MDETQQNPWWSSFNRWGQPAQNQQPAWLQTKPVMNQTMSIADTNGATPTWFDASSPAIAKPVGLDFNQGSPAYMASMNGPGAPGYTPTAMDQAFGYRDANGAHMGYAGAGIAGANMLLSGYVGLQQLSLAKESLAAAKNQFSLNFANSAKSTNSALEDRQRARVASNAGAYQSVGDYMNQNRVNGVA
jgi:hypothetical protein